MEKNKQRQVLMYVFRFFVPEKWRNTVKNFYYSKKANRRYRHLIKNHKNANRNNVNDLVVTLTSYPARIATINETLVSLLNQNLTPEKVILWLAIDQFPNGEIELPEKLLKLKEYGLEIKWCRDLKSYKKLIPALEIEKNKIYVTADDDIFYPKNWLKNLYEDHLSDTTSIFCHRIHRLNFHNDGSIKPYQLWDKCLKKGEEKEGDVLFFTTGGGVLFPPNCFYKDVLNENLFTKLAPLADDLWFWMMIILNNKKIKIVKNNINQIENNAGTQEKNPLWKTNREAGYNDQQLKNLLNHYQISVEELIQIFTPTATH